MGDDRNFRRKFFQALDREPLDPTDPRYLPLYEEESDVILLLKETIDFSPERSAQLLSGYRGAGKSTELRRLKQLLMGGGEEPVGDEESERDEEIENENYAVILIDLEDYLDLSTPLDITTFLLALCGAMAEKLKEENLLKGDLLKDGLGRRLWNFLNSDVEIKEISATAKVGAKAKTEVVTFEGGFGAGMKAELRTNPLFRQRIEKVLSKSLGHFIAEVRGFVAECVAAVKKCQKGAGLVVLVDSIEHARGTNETEAKVHESLERLFADHDDKLKLPGLHLVYTVPPWLRIRRPNIGSPYSGAGLYTLPAQKVVVYKGNEVQGQPYQPGLKRLRQLVEKRGSWRTLLGDDSVLDKLILVTGGHLRDLLRLLQTVAIEARDLPASEAVCNSAIGRIRAQFTPIAQDDAVWLAQIARTRAAELNSLSHVGSLARYFDSHLVLCYQNGEEWFDVHPIVRDLVLEQAARPTESATASSDG